MRVDYLEGSEANQIGNGNQTVQAVATACSLLDEIIQNLGGVNKIDILQAEEALVKLRAWSRTLPVDLRRFPCHDSACATSADRQFAFGILHVSCVYYFTVILVTRPFLTVDLVGRLKPKPRYPSTHPADLVVASKVSKLSQVCLTSALYMAEICDKYASSCLLIGNFCFVKYESPLLSTCAGKLILITEPGSLAQDWSWASQSSPVNLGPTSNMASPAPAKFSGAWLV